jgi:hypothetical protein
MDSNLARKNLNCIKKQPLHCLGCRIADVGAARVDEKLREFVG